MKLKLLLRTSSNINPEDHHSCFVRLHPESINTLYQDALHDYLDHNQQNVDNEISTNENKNHWCVLDENKDDILFLPLQISYTTHDESVISQYVSANGGIIDQEEFIEVPESIIHPRTNKNVSEVTVHIHPLNTVYDAESIHLEPLSTNDWELLEIYAVDLEAGILLNQVSIVYPLQILPLKLGRDMVYVRVLQDGFSAFDGTSSQCLRLVSQSKVLISPKPRSQPDSVGNDTTTLYSPSAPVRICPTEGDFSKNMKELHHCLCCSNRGSSTMSSFIPCPSLFSALMHPNTLSDNIKGWDEESEIDANTSLSSCSPSFAYATLTKVERSAKGNEQHKTSVVIVQLVSSKIVPTYCIAIHPSLRAQLNVTPLMDFIQVQILKESQMKDHHEILGRQLDEILHFKNISLSSVYSSLEHKYQSSNTWRYPEDFSNSPAIGYGENTTDLFAVEDSFVTQWTDTASLQDSTSSSKQIQDREADSSDTISVNLPNEYLLNVTPSSILPSESTVELIEEIEKRLLRKIPFVKNCNVDITRLNNVLISGEKGSGKTYTSLLVAAKIRMMHNYSTIYLDCHRLQSSVSRMDQILNEINNAFKQCVDCRPSILILDNLDELIINAESNATDDPGSAYHQTKTNPTLAYQSKLLSDHVQFLVKGLNFIHDAQPGIVILSTCQNVQNLHRGIYSMNAFATQVPPLIDTERLYMFKDMLKEKGILMQESDFDRKHFSKSTEGFRPYDLKLVASRVATEQRRRYYLSDEREEYTSIMSIKEDVEEVLTNYTPLFRQSLEGQDSSAIISWFNVGGLFNAKAALSDTIARPMKYKLIYENLPISLPKGILLYGYPGAGKSCIVPALAKECSLSLVTCRGPELFDKYIGSSEAKVRELFEKAYSVAPSILFLDEFDSLAPKRGSDNTGVTDRVVNQLLTFLDGVEVHEDKEVYIIAASSRPDKIDPALLRPGRLERHIFIGFAESDEEWNDLITKIALTRNIEDSLLQSISDGSFINSLVNNGVPYQKLSAADIRGTFDTAHLQAIHEYLNLSRNDLSLSTESQMIDDDIKVSSKNLMDAFCATRTSLSISDRMLLARSYVPFLGAHRNMRGLGLDPSDASSFSVNDLDGIRQLKTALK